MIQADDGARQEQHRESHTRQHIQLEEGNDDVGAFDCHGYVLPRKFT
jgi:hypothetical protein